MRSILLGTDEAGYGPNLGPLIISATHWDVPGKPGECDLWDLLAPAVCQDGACDDKLHIADSKVVYSPARGLAALERSVLALLGACGDVPQTYSELRARLAGWRACEAAEFDAPWYREHDVSLPVENTPDEIEAARRLLRRTLDAGGVELIDIRSDLVTEPRFNSLTDAADSKGAVLTHATLTLACTLWETTRLRPGHIHCDKHGGRNFYSAALTELTGGEFVMIVAESHEQSVYAVGRSRFSFETRAERRLPVAAASMVSKYLREVSMIAFNDFWRSHLPDVKPTKGYPTDSHRFRRDIAAKQAALGMPDDLLWRRR